HRCPLSDASNLPSVEQSLSSRSVTVRSAVSLFSHTDGVQVALFHRLHVCSDEGVGERPDTRMATTESARERKSIRLFAAWHLRASAPPCETVRLARPCGGLTAMR